MNREQSPKTNQKMGHLMVAGLVVGGHGLAPVAYNAQVSNYDQDSA